MSEPKKYENVSDGYTARFLNTQTGHAAPKGEYVRYDDYAKVKEAGQNMLQHLRESTAEVERLKAEVERLVDERCLRGEGMKQKELRITRLRAQVERLTKSGDEMAADLIGEFGSYNSVDEWNAAKKGCQP
jgi:ABC-type phosphate transport system auxiliary subunit